MLLSPQISVSRVSGVSRMTFLHWTRSCGRQLTTFPTKHRTWQQTWKRAAKDGAEGGRFLLRSVGAGIVGVGVLFVSWPILDNVIAPVAVRYAMNSAPHGVEAFCGREAELDQLDDLLDGTNPGIWILEGVGKTSLLRMEQARRPCTYINLRETSTVNDLVFQLVTHLYQPLGSIGNLITSYTQLVHASIKLVGASDGEVYNAYQIERWGWQELFFSLYLTHLRRALSATTSTGPVTPCTKAARPSVLSFFQQRSGNAAAYARHQDRMALLVLDHADIAMKLGDKSSEAGYQRLLDELLLLAIAVAQDTGTAQVVIATGSEGRARLEKRLEGLGGDTRRLRVGGLSSKDSAALVRRLVERGGGVGEQELEALEARVARECAGDPKRIHSLVASQLWGLTPPSSGCRVCVGLCGGPASNAATAFSPLPRAADGAGVIALAVMAATATVTLAAVLRR